MRTPIPIVLAVLAGCATTAPELPMPGQVTAPGTTTPQAPPPASSSQVALQPTPECRSGADGVQVCGFHCLTGTDGRAGCANTAEGSCALGADGRVVCTRIAAAQPAYRPDNSSSIEGLGYSLSVPMPGTVKLGVSPAPQPAPAVVVQPQPECHLGGDGQQYCGFNCRAASNGRWFCASSATGQCAQNPDGSYTCR